MDYFHIISHTHWDREWYLTYQQFRMKLVHLIDYTLDILKNNPDFKFMLDGQTVVLEDYLEINPQRESELKNYIKEGRLLVGPWYVLSDEFLSDGESLIRNLLIGHKIAQRFGRVMKVGYLPDIFGHISIMPQILRGFDIDNVVIWRGVDAKETEFFWQSPDRTKVLCIWIPTGYTNLISLPAEPSKALDKLIKSKEDILAKAKNNTCNFLMMNGGDHLVPQINLPHIIAEVNKLPGRHKVLLSTLPEYISQIKRKIKEKNIILKTKKKEFISTKHYFVHTSGVLSSRIYLKQTNEKVEDLLRYYAEPLATFAFSLGKEYPTLLLEKAWKYLLQNQAHDSICGCSIDEVHQDMVWRFKQAEEIGVEILKECMSFIAERVENSDLKEGEYPVLIYNPLNWERDEVISFVMDIPPKKNISLVVTDNDGNLLPSQIKNCGKKKKLFIYPGSTCRKLADFTIREFWQVSFLAKKLPPLGYKKFIIKTSLKKKQNKNQVIARRKDYLENEYLKVKINSNGTINLFDKRTGYHYNNLHFFEDGADSGDEYNYSPPLKDKLINTKNKKAEINLLENGPVRATIKVVLKIKIPLSLEKNRKLRSKEEITHTITSFITLNKGSRRVEIETELDNLSKDHRLRVAFPLGGKPKYSYAGSQFSVVKREVKPPDFPNFTKEANFGLAHQRYFVDINDGEKGLAISAIGLPQFQVTPEGILYLTLLRSVGYLVRDDLLSIKRVRGVHGLINIPTPEAQCLRHFTFKYALLPHSKGWKEISKEAFSFRLPPILTLENSKNASLPASMSFISLEGKNIFISAVKKAEAGNFWVVRFYNLSPKKTSAKLKIYSPIVKIKILNLNEEIQEELNYSNNVFHFMPYEIKTVGIWTKGE